MNAIPTWPLHFGADHPWVETSRSSYGRCLTSLERFDEAEKELLQAERNLVAAHGSQHSKVETVRRRLAELYDRWERGERARVYRARLDGSPAESR